MIDNHWREHIGLRWSCH